MKYSTWMYGHILPQEKDTDTNHVHTLINPFPEQAAEQALDEAERLNSRLFCSEITPSADPRTAGCVCGPHLPPLSAGVCVHALQSRVCWYNCLCLFVSRFLPYYWLRAAFRPCWATPSFSRSSKIFFFIPEEKGGRNFVSWFEVIRLLQT